MADPASVLSPDATRILTAEFRESARVLGEAPDGREQVRALIIKTLCADGTIRGRFLGAAIRLAAQQALVSREIARALGEAPEGIKNLTIGDVIGPPKPVAEAMRDIKKRAHGIHDRLSSEYDTEGRGLPAARSALISYLNRSYDFSKEQQSTLTEQCTLTPGAMHGLHMISFALAILSKREGIPFRVVTPDSGYSTWKSMVDDYGKLEVITSPFVVPTKPENLLHPDAGDARNFYLEHGTEGKRMRDLWCITPVGNPSGTVTNGDELAELCQTIVKCNPECVILLDCAYVRTLTRDHSKALMGRVLQDPSVMQRVFILDSLSKSHGFCGERAGAFMTMNFDLYTGVQNIDMKNGAGHGRFLDTLIVAVAQSSDEEDRVFAGLHEHWAEKKVQVYQFLTQDKFSHLFSRHQPHLDPTRLGTPGGLFLLLKTQNGSTAERVAKETGYFGVDAPLKSGHYIRFSMGIDS